MAGVVPVLEPEVFEGVDGTVVAGEEPSDASQLLI